MTEDTAQRMRDIGIEPVPVVLGNIEGRKKSLLRRSLVWEVPETEGRLLRFYPFGMEIPFLRWQRSCMESDRVVALEVGDDPVVVLGAANHGEAIHGLSQLGYTATAEYRMHLVLDEQKVLYKLFCLQEPGSSIFRRERFVQDILSVVPDRYIAFRPRFNYGHTSKVIGDDIITYNGLLEDEYQRLTTSSRLQILRVMEPKNSFGKYVTCRIVNFPQVLMGEFGCRPSKGI